MDDVDSDQEFAFSLQIFLVSSFSLVDALINSREMRCNQ